jgi:hypothetical protein
MIRMPNLPNRRNVVSLFQHQGDIWRIGVRGEKPIYVYLPPTVGKSNMVMSGDILRPDNNGRMIDTGLPYFRPVPITSNIRPNDLGSNRPSQSANLHCS